MPQQTAPHMGGCNDVSIDCTALGQRLQRGTVVQTITFWFMVSIINNLQTNKTIISCVHLKNKIIQILYIPEFILWQLLGNR